MTELLLASTAPVFKVDGVTHGELARDLIRLEVEEDTAGLKRMQVRFLAQGPAPGAASEELLYLDGAIFDFGKRVEVSIGVTSEARTIFDGTVSGMEVNFEETVPPEVVIFAEDRLMDLRMTRRCRTYENMSDADIARAIASEHGLTPEVDADGPVYDVVQQWNVSDLAFLRERAALIRAEVFLLAGRLFFQSRDKRDGAAITLVQGNHLIGGQARADLAHQRTKVVVTGYDAAAREAIHEEAGSADVRAEVATGLTGPDVLEQSAGERVSHLSRQAPLTAAEAAAWARAEMLRRARGFVTVSAITRGTPDLTVGSRLSLERMGRPFDGDGYYATSVCHTYDALSGHRTRFTAERATVQEGA